MREIKFRAWVSDSRHWLNGAWARYMYMTDGIVNIVTTMDRILIWSQYTGLKDKNGVEIYEGDIVRFDTHSTKGKIEKVEWDDDGMWIPFRDDTYIQDECGDWFKSGFEVIGNIYENPELLEETK